MLAELRWVVLLVHMVSAGSLTWLHSAGGKPGHDTPKITSVECLGLCGGGLEGQVLSFSSKVMVHLYIVAQSTQRTKVEATRPCKGYS